MIFYWVYLLMDWFFLNRLVIQRTYLSSWLDGFVILFTLFSLLFFSFVSGQLLEMTEITSSTTGHCIYYALLLNFCLMQKKLTIFGVSLWKKSGITTKLFHFFGLFCESWLFFFQKRLIQISSGFCVVISASRRFSWAIK